MPDNEVEVPSAAMPKISHRKITPKALPMWMQRYKPPISDDASTLSVTAGWAVQCFVPLVNTLADEFGSEPTAICEAVWGELPQCNIVPTTEAEVELRKRIETAVSALLQSDPAWLNALLGAT